MTYTVGFFAVLGSRQLPCLRDFGMRRSAEWRSRDRKLQLRRLALVPLEI